ncbi:MAG: hypothetical protein JWO68_3527 [Actinomycetia bacterium]|nr:hypothetical protein [Actinomycetes bacterium]
MEPLTPVEARVVGCLVEKQRTVPDTYPLTLNALVSACNQTSNRDPILHLADGDVVRAIDSLKARGMARIVHPATGSRVTKYRHVLDEALGLDDGPLSVVTVLLLRGPQTVAELRTRTERLHAFADLDAVEAALESLGELVERLDRRPGEREPRWTLLLAPSGHPEPVADGLTVTRTDDRLSALEAEVAELRSVVDRLRPLLD